MRGGVGMSNDKPLKRYGPACLDTTLNDGDSLNLFMEEVSGGLYIDEDELRGRLKGLMNAARSREELDAYKRVLELIDEPNW